MNLRQSTQVKRFRPFYASIDRGIVEIRAVEKVEQDGPRDLRQRLPTK
jgi:hypothetical protein